MAARRGQDKGRRDRRAGGGGPRHPRSGSAPRRQRRQKSRAGRLLSWLLLGLSWAVLASGLVIAYYAVTLPRAAKLAESGEPPVVLTTPDGRIVATRGRMQGPPIRLSDMPPYLPEAVIATEDRRFYDHFGIDIWGILRAAYADLRAGGIVQGGSTITQQTAKNLYLGPERTFGRKIQEVLLAIWLDAEYSKAQILTLYLNHVYLGAGTYGVEAASQRYFGKSARDLTLAEAAMVAGLLKAPSRYAPTNDLPAARARAALVLQNMVDAGYLRPEQAKAAQAHPARLASGENLSSANYFADWVMGSLSRLVPERTGALTVVTTLDFKMQKAAEDAVEDSLKRYGAKRKIGQAALVALDPATGAVRAMVGGGSYSDSPFNRAVQAMRQPGSAFKPVVYLTAMERGMTPDTVMRDSPIVFGEWQPQNYGGHYVGPVTLRNALAMSINTVAVKVSERAGRFRVIDMAHKLGIHSELTPTPSVALGTSVLTPLELTNAYAVLANGGAAVKPYGILEIRDAAGHVLYRQPDPRPVAVADSWAVGEVNDMLAGVLRYGTGTAARLADRPAAGKTGTSQSWRDAWFVGYVPQLVAGVWMGNDDNTPTARVTGGTVPAQTWKAFMTKALAGQPALALPSAGPVPPGVYAAGPGAPEIMGNPVPPNGGPGIIESLVDRLRSAFQ